jgi:16S rRNA U516 pseudouridylate synthase RsuA-like enzyme
MIEGRRREVRLLCAGADIPIKRLIRKRFGNLMLGWLAQGHWRNLSQQEVAGLLPRGSRRQAEPVDAEQRNAGRRSADRLGAP